MQYGAVIVAAGMSTRMKQFKQLMEVDNMTLAERVVKKFKRAGIRDIVMVTGYRADELESALKKLGIVFLRNEEYATTQMFDSARIGLRYLNGRSDRVFFCPVDVPFFSENTVRLEMTREEKAVFPICHNRIGHPILFDGTLIPRILEYEGSGGMKGALDSLVSQTACYLPVSDEGVIMDADTPEDLEYLRKLAGDQRTHVETRVMIASARPFFGAGTVTLLKQIDCLHSVREACNTTGISYSKAWKILRAAEDGFGCSLVERRAGGRKGGNAHLTKDGRNLIVLYEELESRIAKYAEQEYCNIFSAGRLFPESSRERRDP